MYNHERSKKIVGLAERALELIMSMKIPSTYAPEESCTVSNINIVWSPEFASKTLEPGDDLIVNIDDFSLHNEMGMRVVSYPAVIIQKSQLSDMSEEIYKIRREMYALQREDEKTYRRCPCCDCDD